MTLPLSTPDEHGMTDRSTFLRGVAAASAGLMVAGRSRGSVRELLPRTGRTEAIEMEAAGLTSGDRAILGAAQVAEALAVTTYAHIVSSAPFYARLFPQDQAYIKAARNEEMAHYGLMHSLTGKPSPYTRFYYPAGMFADARVTVDTLVTLEEAFIAAYLVGVRNFSAPDLRVAAARIMGVESDHRTMARVLAPGVDPADGGPFRAVIGIKGLAEKVDPASNNGYERTLGWTCIEDALAALRPFVDRQAAATVHFDATKAYPFRPFTPTLPTLLGAF